MSSYPLQALAEQPPTPEPASAVVSNDASASLEDLPLAWRKDPFMAYLLDMTPAEEAHHAARSAAVEEGRRRYGDERSDAWLAALRDGTHPLCRVPEPTRR
jgi:hypothetical protein